MSLYHEGKKRWALGSRSGTAPVRGWRLSGWDLDRRALTLKGRAVGVCVRVLETDEGGGGRWQASTSQMAEGVVSRPMPHSRVMRRPRPITVDETPSFRARRGEGGGGTALGSMEGVGLCWLVGLACVAGMSRVESKGKDGPPY